MNRTDCPHSGRYWSLSADIDKITEDGAPVQSELIDLWMKKFKLKEKRDKIWAIMKVQDKNDRCPPGYDFLVHDEIEVIDTLHHPYNCSIKHARGIIVDFKNNEIIFKVSVTYRGRVRTHQHFTRKPEKLKLTKRSAFYSYE